MSNRSNAAAAARPAWQSTTLVERSDEDRRRAEQARLAALNLRNSRLRKAAGTSSTRQGSAQPQQYRGSSLDRSSTPPAARTGSESRRPTTAGVPKKGGKATSVTAAAGLVLSPVPRRTPGGATSLRRVEGDSSQHWDLEQSAPLDPSTVDDFAMRESQSRIVEMLEEQALAQQRTADAAVERVMVREEEAIGLVADRRDRCAATRDRLAGEVEAAARERDQIAAAALAAQRRKDDLEKALAAFEVELLRHSSPLSLARQTRSVSPPRPLLGDGALNRTTRRGPIWNTLSAASSSTLLLRPAAKGSAVNSSSIEAAATGLPQTTEMTLAEKEVHARRVAEQLKAAIDALEASQRSREAELECARAELAELLAVRDSYAGTEAELKAALRDMSGALKDAATRRLRIPLLESTLASLREQHADESSQDHCVNDLMERAKLDDAMLTEISSAADKLGHSHNPEEATTNVGATIAKLVLELKRDSEAIEQATLRAVHESEMFRLRRERDIQDLRERIATAEERAAKTRRMRSEMCL